MVGKLLIGRDFATQQEGGVRLSHSDTQLEYGDSVDGIAFPRSSEGNQLTQFTGKGGRLALHDIYILHPDGWSVIFKCTTLWSIKIQC